MKTFEHENGYSVKVENDGSVWLSSNSLITSRLRAKEAQAFRDSFLSGLGLWFDMETGLLVSTTPNSVGGHMIITKGGAKTVYRNPLAPDHSLEGEALKNYLRYSYSIGDGKLVPGEVWLVTMHENLEEVVAVVHETEDHQLKLMRAYPLQEIGDNYLEKKKIITASGEYVGDK